jgi:hypothetical protein
LYRFIEIWTNSRTQQQPEQASINQKGCLGGSDGKYTVAEDGTTQTFRIISSAVDRKPHLGHAMEVMGPTANMASSSASADNTGIITGVKVNMISDHCATAADTTPAATASAALAEPTPTATASPPALADRTPAATASAPMTASTSARESTEHRHDTASWLLLLGLGRSGPAGNDEMEKAFPEMGALNESQIVRETHRCLGRVQQHQAWIKPVNLCLKRRERMVFFTHREDVAAHQTWSKLLITNCLLQHSGGTRFAPR